MMSPLAKHRLILAVITFVVLITVISISAISLSKKRVVVTSTDSVVIPSENLVKPAVVKDNSETPVNPAVASTAEVDKPCHETPIVVEDADEDVESVKDRETDKEVKSLRDDVVPAIEDNVSVSKHVLTERMDKIYRGYCDISGIEGNKLRRIFFSTPTKDDAKFEKICETYKDVDLTAFKDDLVKIESSNGLEVYHLKLKRYSIIWNSKQPKFTRLHQMGFDAFDKYLRGKNKVVMGGEAFFMIITGPQADVEAIAFEKTKKNEN